MGPTTNRDEAVLVTAVGVHSVGRLLLRLVAVAQAAHATDPGTGAGIGIAIEEPG